MDNTQKAVLVGGVIAAGVGAVLYFGKADATPDPDPGLASLWGVVEDADTGEKLSGITVSLGGNTTSTDSNGKYEFVNVTPDSYALIFTDPTGEYETLEL